MTAAAEEVTKQLEGNRDESCSKTMPPNEATPATAAAATANAEASNANNGGSDESGKMVEGGGGGGAKVAFTAASDTKLEIGTVDEGGGSGKKAKQGLYIYQKYLHKQNLYPALTKAELMPFADDPFWVRLRWFLFALFWLAWLAMLVTAVVIIALAPKCYRPAPKQWWQKGPIYQVYPKSFKDTDGDGIGDIKGITEKLDYLSDLGVGSVWVSPIYPSPQKDNGYDISDFTDIDPTLGNLQDFDNLLAGIHERGLKLIMDFVPNHSSDQHEWFKKSVKREAPFTDYYVWRKGRRGTPPNNWKSVFGGSAWEWNSERGEYYLHQFLKEQPDLNVRNADVVSELKKILQFWLDRGVDGFRMDAVSHLFEDKDYSDEKVTSSGGGGYDSVDHSMTNNLPEVLDLLEEFRDVLDTKTEMDEYNPRIMMTEAYLPTESVMEYYGTNFTEHAGSISHMPMNFAFIEELNSATDVTADKLNSIISNYLTSLPNPGAWPNFNLGNHDRQRVATRLGHDLVDVLNMVTMLLPGTPITYYGEEIGMVDGKLESPNDKRDPSRTPMQWDSIENAGFSSGSPWLPLNLDFPHVNAKTQLESSHNTHIKIYRTLSQLRQQPSILFGSFNASVSNGTVFAYSRVKKGNPGYVVAVNLGEEEVAGIDLSDFPMLPGSGLVEARSHHDRDDKAKEVEMDGDAEALGRSIDFTNFSLLPKEGIIVNFVPSKE